MDICVSNYIEIGNKNIFSIEDDFVFEDDWIFVKGEETSINSRFTSRSKADECEHNVELYATSLDLASSLRYLDTLEFLSRRYFSFSEGTYRLMVDDITKFYNITIGKLNQIYEKL